MKHIDNVFKEKLYNHNVPVPEGMWEKIAPIAEEESGRALLWFWFAGILALLLGGFGIYKMVETTITEPPIPNTLVSNQGLINQSINLNIHDDLITESNSNTLKENVLPNDVQNITSTEVNELELIAPVVNNTITKDDWSPASHQNVNYQVSKLNNPQSVIKTVENIPNVYGTPANLVITKSYVNKKGAVIKQSNFTHNSVSENPVYNVIINSEANDMNAGVLLRIIEPLKIIPLPAFQKKLKKKITISKF